MNKISKKDKRYLMYLFVFVASLIKTMMPLIESLLGLSFDVSSFLNPIEVSNEDILLAFEDVPSKLGALLVVFGVFFVLFEIYVRDKERE